LYWRLAIISGEVRRSIIVGTVSLGGLLAKSIAALRTPARNIV
jgi:hypothetical protein